MPVRKELYFASSSVGAYKFTGIDSSSQPSMDEMKQRAIHLPIALAHQGVVVVASRSHQTEETTAFIDNLRKQGKPVTLISSGSSPEDLSGSGRLGRYLSPFRPDDGVGYRRRPRHR